MSDFPSPFGTKSLADVAEIANEPLTVAPVGQSPLSAVASSAAKYKKLEQFDLFFRFTAIDKARFNQRYPYKLWIMDEMTNTRVAEFTFPLAPQNISISVPAASVMEATMKGIVETHNGAPFRPISIAGTTGTNVITKTPGKDSGTASPDWQRSLEYAFQNTIKSAYATANQVNRTVRAFSGGSDSTEGPLNYKISEINTLHTGYESIHDLERFLDYYLAGKKLKENRSWRLYFLMHKDQKYYACSLTSYSVTKSAGTNEYQYSINLNAFRRLPTVPGGAKRLPDPSASRSVTNTLSNILNGIRQARTTIAAAHRVLAGIRSDINDSFIRPVGEIALMAKDLQGLRKDMYDFAFSGSTTKAMQESFKQYFIDNKSSMQRVAATVAGIGLIGGLTAQGKAQSALNTSATDKLSSGQAEQYQQAGDSADPLKALFENPADHPDVFQNFPIDDMNLPGEIVNQLDSITEGVMSMNADDVIQRRTTVANFARDVSEALGGGSASYNAVLGLAPPKNTYKKLTVDDIVLLNNMNDIIKQMDSLAALLDQSDGNDREDYYRFYADYAIASGLNFSNANLSRFFVPFPEGGTLEQLATQYLGAPERWIEIAALNGLKAPYVDQVGYDIAVTASSGGDTLTVADAQYLYIGQVVRVKSDTIEATVRKVRSIDIVSSVETIITFEASNSPVPLTAYKPSQNARIHTSMPNTVNSDMLIAIPSSNAPLINTPFKTSPEINELDPIVRTAKVDFLQDSSGDWILTGGGDIKLAYGLTNLIQAAMMIINTKTNELLQNPSFGNPVDAGMALSDVSAKSILASLARAFDADPRFAGVLAGDVTITGGAVVVSLLLGIKNTQLSLPVQAEIPR
jgi:hypothetical protein